MATHCKHKADTKKSKLTTLNQSKLLTMLLTQEYSFIINKINKTLNHSLYKVKAKYMVKEKW